MSTNVSDPSKYILTGGNYKEKTWSAAVYYMYHRLHVCLAYPPPPKANVGTLKTATVCLIIFLDSEADILPIKKDDVSRCRVADIVL